MDSSDFDEIMTNWFAGHRMSYPIHEGTDVDLLCARHGDRFVAVYCESDSGLVCGSKFYNISIKAINGFCADCADLKIDRNNLIWSVLSDNSKFGLELGVSDPEFFNKLEQFIKKYD